LNIVIVTQSYYPTYGGVSEHVHHTAAALRRRGNQVSIITSNQGKWPDSDEKVVRIGRNITVPFNGARVNLTVGPGISRKLTRAIQHLQPDLVQVHCPLTPTLPLMAIKHSVQPVVGTFHSTSSSDTPYRLFRKPLLKYVNRLSGRIAVSRSAERFVSRVFPGRYEIIPNGVDTDRFDPAARPLEKFSDGAFNVLYVGRLDPRKGIIYLLEAFAAFARLVSGRTRLIVVGGGPHERIVKRFAETLGPRLAQEGLVHPNLLPRYYASADVVCSPAVGNESFGIVLLEAMASGRPLIATDIPGYRTVVEPGIDSMLVTPRDPGGIVNALLALYEDEELRRSLGRRGRDKSLRYSWSRVAARLEGYFREVLSGKPSEMSAAPGKIESLGSR